MTVAPAPATASTAAAAPIRCQGRCLPRVLRTAAPRCWRAAAQASVPAANPAPWSTAAVGCAAPNRMDSATTTAGAAAGATASPVRRASACPATPLKRPSRYGSTSSPAVRPTGRAVVSSWAQPETATFATERSTGRLSVPVWPITPPKSRNARALAATTAASGILARWPAWLSSRPRTTPAAPAARYPWPP